MKMQNILIGMVAIFVSASAWADSPAITDVTVRQCWPWSRLVNIDYVLDCGLRESMDITVSVYNGSEQLDVPEDSFSGDFYGARRGACRIVWDPTKTAYTNNGVIPKFRVALTPTPSPLYMIINLNKSTGDEGHIDYVYEEDLTNGHWGAWARNPVTNLTTPIQSVIWTGVATNDIYKTDKFVLRRIPKGTFEMGGTHTTTLTKDFYVGVFPMTNEQWSKAKGTQYAGTKLSAPAAWMTYNDIRGATNDVPAINWPTTGSLVKPASFLGRLRTKTGLMNFDLPTEAQWEYACRADTTTYYNDGINGSSTNQMNALGWWSGNSESTQPVGEKMPNAWGLYDMHGNVWEWCLDWRGFLQGGVDPKGAESGTHRMTRGGSWRYPATQCHSAYRDYGYGPAGGYNALGLRLVCTLP